LIADAVTEFKAWTILHKTYSSTDVTNMMRIEEEFRRACKTAEQNMEQWIGYMRSLATQLREVGVEILANRVATCILNGLGQEYKELKYALRARPGNLTVELVTQHLLTAESDNKAAEGDNKAEDKTVKLLHNIQHTGGALRTMTLNTLTYQVRPSQQTSGSMHGPMAMAITTLND